MDKITVISESPNSLLIDGNKRTGLYVVGKATELAIKKATKSKMVITGVTNTEALSGLIGSYARKATENNLIYIGFNNSPGGLIPFGATKEVMGTNPLTIGIPTHSEPVILDMASSKITWGDLMVAKNQQNQIPKDSALDGSGNATVDPSAAMQGGLLPFGGYKGSGLGIVVELLAGAVTKSMVGKNVKGGWGSLFILIDPELFRPIEDFKDDVQSFLDELKALPKAKGVKEVYYPGEHSQKTRQKHIKSGCVSIADEIYNELVSYIS